METKAERVSQAVWTWREAKSRHDPVREASALHRKAFIQVAIMAAVAFGFLWFKKFIPAGILFLLALFFLASAFFFPVVFKAVDRAAQKFGQWVGVGMTWLLLTPFFYLCFVPGRLLILLTGKDPMNRRFPSPTPTHWVPRPPVRSPDQYRKQF